MDTPRGRREPFESVQNIHLSHLPLSRTRRGKIEIQKGEKRLDRTVFIQIAAKEKWKHHPSTWNIHIRKLEGNIKPRENIFGKTGSKAPNATTGLRKIVTILGKENRERGEPTTDTYEIILVRVGEEHGATSTIAERGSKGDTLGYFREKQKKYLPKKSKKVEAEKAS